MGIWALVFGATFPLGGWLLGEYAGWVGVERAILTGVGAALLVLAYLRGRLRRRAAPGVRARAVPAFPPRAPDSVAP